MTAPIAPKAQAAGASAAVAGAALWVLGTYVFKGNVPDGIASMVYIAVPALVAFGAAWLAPHQVRPGDTPAPAPAAPVVATTALTSASSLTEAQMETIRDVLEHEQTAADERKVPPG